MLKNLVRIRGTKVVFCVMNKTEKIRNNWVSVGNLGEFVEIFRNVQARFRDFFESFVGKILGIHEFS